MYAELHGQRMDRMKEQEKDIMEVEVQVDA
jgi:hypothetical protein